MTKEEMFVHLNALKHITDESSMMWLALDMAIKALEQEPCEECFSVIFPECRYCTHCTLHCMPKDSACEKCVKYDARALPSGYQQKEGMNDH